MPLLDQRSEWLLVESGFIISCHHGPSAIQRPIEATKRTCPSGEVTCPRRGLNVYIQGRTGVYLFGMRTPCLVFLAPVPLFKDGSFSLAQMAFVLNVQVNGLDRPEEFDVLCWAMHLYSGILISLVFRSVQSSLDSTN